MSDATKSNGVVLSAGFVLVSLAAGGAAGYFLRGDAEKPSATAPSATEPAPTATAPTGKQPAAPTSNAATPDKPTQPSAAPQPAQPQPTPPNPVAAALLRENNELKGQLAEAALRSDFDGKTIASLKAELQPFLDAEKAKAPSFTFGEFGGHAAFTKSNWNELGEASKVVSDIIFKGSELRATGGRLPRADMLAQQENTELVRKFEYRSKGVLPTHAPQNGELTHPLTTANMLAATFSKHGEPLTEAQAADVARLGQEYEDAYAVAQKLYGPDTVAARKVLDEYRLKGEFYHAFMALCTDRQRALVVDPSAYDVAAIDLYSPTLMLIHSSPTVRAATAEELKSNLMTLLATDQGYKLNDAQTAKLAPHVEAWALDVAQIVAPVPDYRVRNFTYDQGLVAGAATVKLLTQLAAMDSLPKEARTAYSSMAGFYIPRVVSPAASLRASTGRAAG